MVEDIPDFNDTRIAYRAYSNAELKRAIFLFSSLRKPWLMKAAGNMVSFALRRRVPVGWMLKPIIFKHFCGGESLALCIPVIKKLQRYGVRVIPDYSAEGKASEQAFEKVKSEVFRSIELAAGQSGISFAVFKPTGIASFHLWEKLSAGVELSGDEKVEEAAMRKRLDEIFAFAADRHIPVFVDAEETWIQAAIDKLVTFYSERYNRERVVVYNTVQMYRTDRMEFLRSSLIRATSKGYLLGFKIVRGAYHEMEMARAAAVGVSSPVFAGKVETDDAFNAAIAYCFEHREHISFCAATHNETSTMLLARLLVENQGNRVDHISFAQLFGMSDHLTFNLSAAGFQAAKYLPYGPVREVIPYLFRRAEENKAMEGQTGRELKYLRMERERRKAEKSGSHMDRFFKA